MFQKIVAAVDTDAGRSAHVLDAALQLARALGAEVLVTHVQEVERPAALAGTPRPGALPPALHPEPAGEARRLVEQAVARLRGEGVAASGQLEPGEGSTARELIDIATHFGADLIIVGDRGARVSDVLQGGVAHKVVRSAPCSVLLVR
jgi:nucleotide-binding universal stress UspA family protein